MKTFALKTKYATYENCYFLINSYVASDSVAVDIFSDEEGPIAGLTVYIDEENRGSQAYLDTNNSPWAPELVQELGVARFLGKWGQSGYCTYPLYELDMDKLNEYGRML